MRQKIQIIETTWLQFVPIEQIKPIESKHIISFPISILLDQIDYDNENIYVTLQYGVNIMLNQTKNLCAVMLKQKYEWSKDGYKPDVKMIKEFVQNSFYMFLMELESKISNTYLKNILAPYIQDMKIGNKNKMLESFIIGITNDISERVN